MAQPRLPDKDQQLVQIVDAALADAARRSGEWLVCRVGCTQCCVGVFAISQLDALRLRHGMAELEHTNPERARELRDRVKKCVARLAAGVPGYIETGFLQEE